MQEASPAATKQELHANDQPVSVREKQELGPFEGLFPFDCLNASALIHIRYRKDFS
jgi:hypothetical protein